MIFIFNIIETIIVNIKNTKTATNIYCSCPQVSGFNQSTFPTICWFSLLVDVLSVFVVEVVIFVFSELVVDEVSSFVEVVVGSVGGCSSITGSSTGVTVCSPAFLVIFSVYVFFVFPSSATTTISTLFSPSFNAIFPSPDFTFAFESLVVAYIYTFSASFGTSTLYWYVSGLNPLKSYCFGFKPKSLNLASDDFVVLLLFELAELFDVLLFELPALFDVLLFSVGVSVFGAFTVNIALLSTLGKSSSLTFAIPVILNFILYVVSDVTVGTLNV